MLDPKERAEKIRQAPSNSGRWVKQMSAEKREEHLTHALHHDNDSGLSSTDEHIYLKQKQVEGK